MSEAMTPKDDGALGAKGQLILEAATRLFLEHGFEAPTMDQIAREAGVSKATLYMYFEGKADLFAAIIKARCAAIRRDIEDLSRGQAEPNARLVAMCRRLLELMVSERGLAIYRVVVSQRTRFPELGSTYFEAGVEGVLGALTDAIEGLRTEHLLPVKDAPEAARILVGLMRGEFFARRLLAASDPIGAVELDRMANWVVSVFLRTLPNKDAEAAPWRR